MMSILIVSGFQMQINVGGKLWLAFFGALSLCILTFYLLVHNSLKQGFLDYTSQQSVQRLEILRSSLKRIYADEGSFARLQTEPERWLNLKEIIFAESESLFAEDFTRVTGEVDTKLPQRYYREFVSSITLHDPDKNLLLGVVKPEQTLYWLPIDTDNSLIGFIGFVKPTVVAREVDRKFMQHQLKVFSVVGLFVLGLSTAVATLLSRRISRPLIALAQGAEALASGNYQQQMKVTTADEIGQLCKSFNTLAQTLAANEKSRALWIADISHEMRTPVSVIKAQIEAMQDGIRPLSQQNLDLLYDKTQGLNRLIDDLFELSLSDIGALTYNKQHLDLAALLKSCIHGFHVKARDAGLQLRDLVTDNHIGILADSKRLEQLFANLLENSIRYTHHGGCIEVSLKLESQKVLIHIQDTAPGVPEDQQEKIFERLYRLENSRNRSTGGAGLGLSICKNIVTAHQGKIIAYTSPLGGLGIQIEFEIT
jgi:two-component system sensor histidine kinase BaeS